MIKIFTWLSWSCKYLIMMSRRWLWKILSNRWGVSWQIITTCGMCSIRSSPICASEIRNNFSSLKFYSFCFYILLFLYSSIFSLFKKHSTTTTVQIEFWIVSWLRLTRIDCRLKWVTMLTIQMLESKHSCDRLSYIILSIFVYFLFRGVDLCGG